MLSPLRPQCRLKIEQPSNLSGLQTGVESVAEMIVVKRKIGIAAGAKAGQAVRDRQRRLDFVKLLADCFKQFRIEQLDRFNLAYPIHE